MEPVGFDGDDARVGVARGAGLAPAMEPVGFDGDDQDGSSIFYRAYLPAMEPVGFDGDDKTARSGAPPESWTRNGARRFRRG